MQLDDTREKILPLITRSVAARWSFGLRARGGADLARAARVASDPHIAEEEFDKKSGLLLIEQTTRACARLAPSS